MRRKALRISGVTLAGVYIALLLVVPARLVVARLPISLPPSMLFGLLLLMLWLFGHFLNTLAMAKGRSAVRTMLSALLVTQLITYGVATRNFLPTDELNGADRALIAMVCVIGVALAVCDGVRGVDGVNSVMKVTICAVTFVSLVGILQFGLDIDLTRYLKFPGLVPVLTDNSFILERSGLRRPAGTTNHPIEFGIVCAVAVPLAAHYAFRARTRGEPAARWFLCLLLLAMGAVVSLSRTAIIGLAVAGVFLLLAWPKKRSGGALLVVGMFVGAMQVGVPGLAGTIYGLFAGIGTDSSIIARTDDYATAGKQIDLHPFFGRGFGTYLPTKYGPLDNQYLGTIVENGYVGLFVMITLLVVAIGTGLLVRRLTTDRTTRELGAAIAAAIGVLAAGAATFDLLYFGMATGLLFVLIGLAGALMRGVRAEAGPRVRPRPRHAAARAARVPRA